LFVTYESLLYLRSFLYINEIIYENNFVDDSYISCSECRPKLAWAKVHSSQFQPKVGSYWPRSNVDWSRPRLTQSRSKECIVDLDQKINPSHPRLKVGPSCPQPKVDRVGLDQGWPSGLGRRATKSALSKVNWVCPGEGPPSQLRLRSTKSLLVEV